MTRLRKPLPLPTNLRNNSRISNLTTHRPRRNNQVSTPILPLQPILDRPSELEPAVVDIICQDCGKPVFHEVLEGPGFKEAEPEDVYFGDGEYIVGEVG